ncbi:patatin-like phospholipase family protein [Mesonia maritima]|uniref:Patatin/cPLA2 family phospholipase n=1 Tax=Mesonia maritima TaxID=1793873 RepID=A0ABU1K428_9FLAO|nr:patatin-like phospholipase family protein [Mesonia maritima]MDR6300379.1 putative patatin/cPLA2 family phospholipase [Mesonia maritima]
MRALVISGGGSKGAYAGGVAEHLIRMQQRKYDMFVGSSTGSLLLTHLAVDNIYKLHTIYTNVKQSSIFSLNPFIIRHKKNREYVTINYLNTILQFLKSKRTFGESKNLRKLIQKNITEAEFEFAKRNVKDLVITVSNLTKNIVEYKSIHDCSYEDFCDWIWISCNYVPFMSLVNKNDCEYADGGFGSVVPIREAIRRGATEIDAIILESENMEHTKVLGKNPFSLMVNLYGFVIDQIERSNIIEGKLAAVNKDVVLNLYYTPSKLTENSLVFNKELMTNWWQQGFNYAAKKAQESKENELKDR